MYRILWKVLDRKGEGKGDKTSKEKEHVGVLEGWTCGERSKRLSRAHLLSLTSQQFTKKLQKRDKESYLYVQLYGCPRIRAPPSATAQLQLLQIRF